MSAADESLLEEFALENKQNMVDMEQDLLALEKSGADSETINRMFRAIHSMKGSSGYLGFNNILSVSHLGETLLDELRKGEREATAEVIDVLLEAVDALREMLETPDMGESYSIESVMATLNAIVNNEDAAEQSGSSEKSASCDNLELLEQFRADTGSLQDAGAAMVTGKSVYIIDSPDETEKELQSCLTGVGEILATSKNGQFLFSTVLEKDFLKECFTTESTKAHLINKKEFLDWRDNKGKPEEKKTPAPQKKEESTPPAPVASERSASKASQTESKSNGSKETEGAMIKINARLLDELLRFTGNMVMSRNQLLTRYDFSDDAAFATLSQAITEVHRNVVQTRMLSVSSLFDRFRRVIRDLSKKLGKKVEMRTQGGDLELDRTILEAFVDPLTHMVRNSLDHGIETEEERLQTTKNPTATITLRAYQESGEIIISVSDDGRGIDTDRVRAKAIERGIISQKKAEDMSEKDAVKLILEPGFSTAEKLSEVSGRGVGMDVVRNNIENLGGVLDCQTEKGAGTTIQARLPLTKAMVTSSLISALVVRVDGHRFCIPQSAVNELITVSLHDRQDKIKILQGQEVFQHRELVLPIIHLQDALKLEETDYDNNTPKTPDERTEETSLKSVLKAAQTLIVLQHRKNLFGVMVDEIIGIEEAVVREMPSLVEGASVFSGHTVLGDGRVVMLIDINGIVEQMNMEFTEQAQEEHSDLPALSVGKRADRQTMIIFNYNENEYFAIPLELVSLVEKIRNQDIRTVGERRYYPFKGNTVPLLYLDKHLPISPINRNLENYNLILPARVKFPIGVITNSSMTVCEVSGRFDSKITHERGVLGTFMHDDKLVMLLDLYALFEHDDPEHFDTNTSKIQEPARILIVEDSLFYRRLNKTYLSGPTRELTMANDGIEALAALRNPENRFDMVVSDIEMPNMDGFELIKEIRSDPKLKDIPVIALTALQDDASRDRGLRLGFDEYVVKVDKDSLNQSVNRYAKIARDKKKNVQGVLTVSP